MFNGNSWGTCDKRCRGKNNDKNKDKQVGLNIVHTNYSYNVKSLTDTVKFMDGIFVGKVKSIDGYCYEAPIVVDGKSGEEVVYDTYTNYEIEVLNIFKEEQRSV